MGLRPAQSDEDVDNEVGRAPWSAIGVKIGPFAKTTRVLGDPASRGHLGATSQKRTSGPRSPKSELCTSGASLGHSQLQVRGWIIAERLPWEYLNAHWGREFGRPVKSVVEIALKKGS
jgi:hypothetical protein